MGVLETANNLTEYLSNCRQPLSGEIKKIFLNGVETTYLFYYIGETEELIFFDDETKRYSKRGSDKVRSFCEAVLRNAEAIPIIRSALISEVEHHVKRNSYCKLDEFDNELPSLIPLVNGIYDLTSGELAPYSEEYRFLNTLAVEYNPEAKCPKIEKFLDEICTTEKGAVDVAMRRGLIQIVAYCLWRGYPIQKIFFLIGGGSNGKGVFCVIVQALLGSENTSSTAITKLCHDRFAAADLEGKYSNISNELTVAEIKNFDAAKSLVSGTDSIRVERKGIQAYQAKPNHAKLIVATNKPPISPDASDGFFRRLMLFFFQRQFLGKDAKLGLERELTTKEELSGLLNLALMELRSWVDEKGDFRPDTRFCCDMPIDAIRELYERASDTIAAFEYDCLDYTHEPEDVIGKEALYAAYRSYCHSKKVPPQGDLQFKREFAQRNAGKVREEQPRKGSGRERVYIGLKLVAQMEQVKEDSQPTISVAQVAQEFSYSPANKKDNYTLTRVIKEIVVPSVPITSNEPKNHKLLTKEPVPSVPLTNGNPAPCEPGEGVIPPKPPSPLANISGDT